MSGRSAAVIATLGRGELLRWSWLIPSRRRHPGAEAAGAVHAYESDASAVMAMCGKDPVPNQALFACVVAGVIAARLTVTRVRPPGLYAPCGSGPVP